MTGNDFRKKYGPWALVAGASEGLGEEFARQIAERGLNLVLVARRRKELEALAADIRKTKSVEVMTICWDLSNRHAAARIEERTHEIEIGLLVYNAALSLIGPFLDLPVEQHLRVLDLNSRGPLLFTHAFGRKMVERRRGGIILMASLSGYQGTALVASYAASKAFNIILAEGLWDEMRDQGVDMLACAAGVIRTPNYLRSKPSRPALLKAPEMEPRDVAAEALAALGRGPTVIPGRANRVSSAVMQRLMPRSLAIATIGRATRGMYGK
jgi:short-subunit dehydrogenase